MKFSIIVVFKNSEKTLERCLDSIVRQKYDNIEVIMVDSDSTDASVLIIEKYKAILPIKYFNSPAGGVGQARNVGIHNITGDYVLFLDSDDFFLDGLFDILNKRLSTDLKNIDIVRFNAKKIVCSETSEYELNKYFMKEISKIKTKEMFELFDKYNIEFGPLWLYCYNSNFIKENNFEFLKDYMHEDLLNDYILSCAKYLANINYTGYCYVKSETNATSKKSNEQELFRAKSIIANYDYVVALLKAKLKYCEFFNIRKKTLDACLLYDKKYFSDYVLDYYNKEIDVRLKGELV